MGWRADGRPLKSTSSQAPVTGDCGRRLQILICVSYRHTRNEQRVSPAVTEICPEC